MIQVGNTNDSFSYTPIFFLGDARPHAEMASILERSVRKRIPYAGTEPLAVRAALYASDGSEIGKGVLLHMRKTGVLLRSPDLQIFVKQVMPQLHSLVSTCLSDTYFDPAHQDASHTYISPVPYEGVHAFMQNTFISQMYTVWMALRELLEHIPEVTFVAMERSDGRPGHCGLYTFQHADGSDYVCAEETYKLFRSLLQTTMSAKFIDE